MSWALGLGAGLLLVVACGRDDKPGRPPPYVGGGGQGGQGTTNWPCEDGETRECWQEIGWNGDVLTCFHGQETCEDGTWGPCIPDGIADGEMQPAAEGQQPMASSPMGMCDTPCDPSCQDWSEDPAGATTPTPTTVPLQGGSLSALPSGHVAKLLKEPCDGPEDCMCDHYCDMASGQCKPYLPGEHETCGGPDLTMPVPCDGHVWVCNRGDQPAPAGLIVAIINGNSNHLQWSVGKCSGLWGTLETECDPTTEPIDPGECIDVAPLCGGLPGGTKHIVVNSDDYPPTVGECDCGQNHCAMHNAAANPCTTFVGYTQLVHKQIYEATCPSGQSPQWGYLAYAASTPANASGSSSVLIQAQSATTAAGLSDDCTGCVTVAAVPASEPEACTSGGPPPCPINLYAKLGLPEATLPVLELVFTLNPTPDSQVGPEVTAWELTYSCIDSE